MNRSTLKIWQQNTNKSLLAQLDLLNLLRKDKYDICALQEPHIDFKGKTWANYNWTVIYPTTHNKSPEKTQSAILVNSHLTSDLWCEIAMDYPDLTGVQIQGYFSTIRIINIYNDCKHNGSLEHLTAFLCHPPPAETKRPIYTVWVGDFNQHYPIWDKARNAHLFTRGNLELTQPLLNRLAHYDMKMALPPYTATLCAHNSGNYTRVDNVFCTASLLDLVVKCDTDDAT